MINFVEKTFLFFYVSQVCKQEKKIININLNFAIHILHKFLQNVNTDSIFFNLLYTILISVFFEVGSDCVEAFVDVSLYTPFLRVTNDDAFLSQLECDRSVIFLLTLKR